MEEFPRDSESFTEEDGISNDICFNSQIDNLFTNRCTVFSEQCLSLKKNYVLYLSQNISFEKIAAGLSNGCVNIFNLTTCGLEKYSNKDFTNEEITTVCGVKFLDNNSILIGTTCGCIGFYDLRTLKKELNFEANDDTNDVKKSFTCFDINSNCRLICAGTEQILDDVFLLFFDIRAKSLLGGYWESHQDDVTSVKFHPTNPDILISGSTDGLINIFDLLQSTEEDALRTVINTESSVDKLNWHKNIYEQDVLSCITHTSDLKIYDVAKGDICCEYSREKIAISLKRASASHCYTINCHNLDDRSILLLAGSNYNKGEVLRSFQIQSNTLLPSCRFEDNKQIIRSSIFDKNRNLMITGGESGIITAWTSEDYNYRNMQNTLKINK